jgi:hypothetical protein
MSWQTGVYFGILVAAIALTGLLAWQVCRQPNESSL